MPLRRLTHLSRYLPFLEWFLEYRSQHLIGDLMAGIIVAIMLVPQGMAYALLAGLPPQIGLYASIMPLILYALLGTSRTLAVGPVAIVSLLVATGVGQLAQPNTSEYLTLAMMLALLVGILQVLMGVVRLGFLVNFLSHAVISGFTSAAAIIIGFSQLKHLLGLQLPQTESFPELLQEIWKHLPQSNGIILILGLTSIVVLLVFNHQLQPLLKKQGIPSNLILPLTRSGPLLLVLVNTVLVWGLQLHEVAQVKIIGEIPAGLPPLMLPTFDLKSWQALMPTAVAISLVGFMESIAVAKSLASKRRQKIDANQELIGLGAANLSAAFTGGYPVTGGLSRTVVNFSAGANTGLASIITALLIALTVLFFTPLFYFLPQAVLAAIIIVAVLNLIDFTSLQRMWQYNRADAASLLITFGAVLGLGIEAGILVGIVASLGLYLWRTSHPHLAVVGRIEGSEHFRNVLRNPVKTYPHVLAIRVDESLYFANIKALEDYVLHAVSNTPDLKHLVLICSAINFIDASALETLEALIADLNTAGVRVYFAEVKGPVMDQLKKTDFVEKIGRERIFLSTHQAMLALGCN
ncbi:solute carrier family 26 protein (plasmid) [Acaryochloris sp. 'Moss Beach']|uniref:SulP family inorganic anion transporter n=1 Tax=Acaryochloris sp. 'Moss Beach' TaxID=2740837 RepID=UPI001F173306|nr:solute carrier family 26 protein [Acaryochloris sp. 'Moss Beach']UJB72635.1 solute carrier family 26 protein [Acaryochloris sp. 'Moss Beach']